MKAKLRIGYGYWYGDKSPLYRSDFYSRHHIVEIKTNEDGSETVTALCGTKSEQEGNFKHCHYFENMRFFDQVRKSGQVLEATIISCPSCLHWKKWAILRDMVERIEEER